jgi:hypothetical protein
MKFLTPTALLAAALLSVVVALPFLPAAKMGPDRFQLEARLVSAAPTSLQVFYDDGSGFREELAAAAAIPAGTAPVPVLLPIPAGTYPQLRLDPPANGARIELHSLRILGRKGRVIASIPPDWIRAAQQVPTAHFDGTKIIIQSAPGSEDPQLLVAPPRPLEIRPDWHDYLRDLPVPAGAIFAAFVVGLFAAQRLPRAHAALHRGLTALAAHPGRAVFAAAALGAVASAYPVVFLGKSYVSPNLGTVLLYDAYPTVPGYKTGEDRREALRHRRGDVAARAIFDDAAPRAAPRRVPLWNRYNAAGVPLLAQGQSMFGDPVHLFVIAARTAPRGPGTSSTSSRSGSSPPAWASRSSRS